MVTVDATRVDRDAGKIADELISHLSGLVGSRVRVTMEIEAVVESGVPESVVRIVSENGRTLRFSSQGFEEEKVRDMSQRGTAQTVSLSKASASTRPNRAPGSPGRF